jgi:hypothetical protein
MSKSYWLKDEDQTGNFSNEKQDTFDPLKAYTGVRMQKGVPLLDRDWNELEDIRRYAEVMLRKHYIGNGVPDEDSFEIIVADPPGNDFKITGGRCLVDGLEIVNGVDTVLYSTQQGVETLSVPLGDRTDTVYLAVWIEEVTSTQDEALNNANDVRMETCVRHKINWLVKVDEGSQGYQKEAFHHYYDIARIHRKAGKNTIEATNIEDLRSTGLALLLIKKTLDQLTNLSNADIKHKHSRLTGPNGTPDYALAVDQNGNIGIGTTNPSEKLEIDRGNIILGRLEAKNDSLYIGTGGINGTVIPGSSGGAQIEFQNIIDGGNSSQAIHFLTHHIGVSHTRRMTIDKRGNVGIGTSSPGARLDVNGDINVSPYATIASRGRLHIRGEEILFILNKQGVVISKSWGGNGNLHVEGNSYASTRSGAGIDYAEYFESKNGKEIKAGTSVALDEGKIRPAKKGETPIGIISNSPLLAGGVHMKWHKQYLRDEFGNPVIEEYKEEIMIPKKEKIKKEIRKMEKKTVKEMVTRTKVVKIKGKYCQKEITETIEREIQEPVFKEVDLYDTTGKNKIGKHKIPVMETYEEEIDVLDDNGRPVMVGSGKFETKTRPKINPEYDETKEYIPRQDRPEWNCVGLLGQLPLRKGQPVAPSWIKIKDISNDVELWLVR